MRRRHLLRFLVLAALGLWVAVPVTALAVGLHIAGDGHHEEKLAAALATSAAHGHHHGHDHGEVGADHDHSALQRSSSSMPAEPCPTGSESAAPAGDRPLVRLADQAPPPTGSPPLFYAHCALLL